MWSENQARNTFGSQKCKSCVLNRDLLNTAALNDEISKLVEPGSTVTSTTVILY